MQTLKLEPLKEKQEEIADLLMSLGAGRNIAYTLAAMQSITEANNKHFELTAGLRQPEVSIVMKELQERGWIKERDEKMPGKGRPRKIYSFKISFKDIIAQLEKHQRTIDARAQANIERLRKLKA